MQTVTKLAFIALLATSCTLTEKGISIDFPGGNPVSVCINAVSDSDVAAIRGQIQQESFPDGKMSRAKFLCKDRCFQASQVTLIMEEFTFEKDKLEIAKFLYHKTENKRDYYVVVDALTYERTKDELREYMATA